MGETIRKGAAAADILGDVRTTLTNAVAKGGDWQAAADSRLQPIVVLADGVDAQLAEAQKAAATALAQLDAGNEEADTLLNGTYDNIWNDVGRPGSDPALDILFPGGASYYAEGDTEEQPDRMELLADLLEKGIHPRLAADRASGYATPIRQGATRLRELVDAAGPLKVGLRLAERTQQAVARHGQVALARLKRQWKADGHSEADIHAIIPDRPTTKKPKPPPAG